MDSAGGPRNHDSMPCRACCSLLLLLLLLLLFLLSCGKTPSLTEVGGAGQDLNARAICAQDPGVEGKRRTAHFDLMVSVSGDGARMQVTVFGPSDDGVDLAAGAPLVLFAPAAGVPRTQYYDYAYRMANHGLAVVLLSARQEDKHTQYFQDASNLLSWLDAPSGLDSERVSGRIDVRRAGAAGHGLGGKIAFLLAESDSRIRAVLGIDPVNTLGGDINNPSALPGLGLLRGRARTGLLGETRSADLMNSCAPSNQNYLEFFDNLPAPAFAITFPTAGHMDFVDDLATCGDACGRCGPGAQDKQAVHQLAVKLSAAFFQTYLYGCKLTESYLTGSEFLRDQATGLVMLRTK